MPLFRNIPGNTTAGFSFEGQPYEANSDGNFDAPLAFQEFAQAHGLELVPDQPPSALVPPAAQDPAAAPGPTLLLTSAPGGGLSLAPGAPEAPGALPAPGEAPAAAAGSQSQDPAPYVSPTKPVMQWTNDELAAELNHLGQKVEPWDRPTAIRTVSAARKPKE